MPQNCVKADGCQILDGITNIALETGFVEYIPGDEASKLILISGHGGRRPKESVPKRLAGCLGVVGEEGVNRKGCAYKHDLNCADLDACSVSTARDENTQEILRLAADEIRNNGLRPHVIISHLYRSRMDPNRERLEAAQGDPFALQVYKEFHSAINHAKQVVKRGVLFDFHGQTNVNATELGYLISKDDLNEGKFDVLETSFRALVKRQNLDKTFFLGSQSLGAFFEEAGYDAVPSPEHPIPGEHKFFRGGFITRYHGSRYDNADEVDAVQLEFPKELRLGSENVVESLGKATGQIITKFYKTWYESFL